MKKVNKEVALIDLETFVNKFLKTPVEYDKLEKLYPDVLLAIQDGLVTFDPQGVPVYTLKDPIKPIVGDTPITTINFITRILPLRLATITKGLNLQEDQLMVNAKMTAEIIGQGLGILDKFSRYDYDVITQIATVFS